MTFPAGALLLFLGACPSGWAPPPIAGRSCGPNCIVSESYVRTAPEGSRWCVKQSEDRR